MSAKKKASTKQASRASSPFLPLLPAHLPAKALAAKQDDKFKARASAIYFASAEALYSKWPTPTCIIVDGP